MKIIALVLFLFFGAMAVAGEPRELSEDTQALIKRYSAAGKRERPQIVLEITRSGKPDRFEQVLAVTASEADPKERLHLLNLWGGVRLDRIGRFFASDPELADRIIDLAAASGFSDAYGLRAQFLIFNGGLEARIDSLKLGQAPEANLELAYLHRAVGSPLAATAAEKANNSKILQGMLLEAGEWKKLSFALEKEAPVSPKTTAKGREDEEDLFELFREPPQKPRLLFRTWAAWHAGDKPRVDSLLQQITGANETAIAFLLIDRPKKALGVLSAGHPHAAISWMKERFDYAQGLRLAQSAFPVKDDDDGDKYHRDQAAGVADEMRDLLGDVEQIIARFEESGARAKLASVAAEFQKNDPNWIERSRNFPLNGPRAASYPARVHWAYINAGMKQDAMEMLAQAAECDGYRRFAHELHQYAICDSSDATVVAFWWRLLIRVETTPLADRLALLQRILDFRSPSSELEKYLQLAIDTPSESADPAKMYLSKIVLPAVERSLRMVPDPEFQEKWRKRLSAASPQFLKKIPPQSEVERIRAQIERTPDSWSPHIELSRELWKVHDLEGADRELNTACILTIGDFHIPEKIGKYLIEDGRLDAAERYLQTIVRTSRLQEGMSSEPDIRASYAKALEANGKFGAAAEIHEINLLFRFDVAQPSVRDIYRLRRVNHVLRARDAVAGSRFDDSAAEIAAAREIFPLHLDLPLALVPALDKAGKKEQADALFSAILDGHADLTKSYPNSALHHNFAAKLAAGCNRELKTALQHAQRAVELSPANSAYLSTLAEVHFALGNRAKALELMNECARRTGNPDYDRRSKEMAATVKP